MKWETRISYFYKGMSTIQNNNKLPPEVLNEVFKNLAPAYSGTWSYKREGNPTYVTDKDIESCLRVCKSWRLVIKKYFKCNNQIKVNDYMLSELAKDIPKFGHTIKAIRLIVHEEDEDVTILTNWLKVLTKCTNLVSLEFSMISSYKLKYLAVLRIRGLKLKNIQRIFIKNIIIYPLQTLDFYLRAQIFHCAKITSLYILDPIHLPVVKKYGGLIPIISRFPNLTNLAIKDSVHTENKGFDIKQLLQVSPRLQKLHLFDLTMIIDNFQINEFENVSLTHLKIKVASLKLTSLNHITSSLFKKVDNLYLYIENLVTDDLSKKETKMLLHEFQTSLLDINDVHVEIINIKKIIKLSNDVTSGIIFESDVDKAGEDEDYEEYRQEDENEDCSEDEYSSYDYYDEFYNNETTEEEEEEEEEGEGGSAL